MSILPSDIDINEDDIDIDEVFISGDTKIRPPSPFKARTLCVNCAKEKHKQCRGYRCTCFSNNHRL